jgi:hypothetical protein
MLLSITVWGGDPVYPTINYEQPPDMVADYRNENMHEPIPDIVELLREVRLIVDHISQTYSSWLTLGS